MIRKLFKIFGLIVLASALVILSFFVNKKKKTTSVKGYSIEIVDSLQNRFIGKKDIAKLLKKKCSIINCKLLTEIDRGLIESRLNSHPSIERTEVYSLVDGSIKIKVWQREPVYRVIGKKNYYVDSRRQLMPLSKNYTKRVLVVSGNVPVSFACSQLFDFCNYISKNEFWNKYIGQIHVKANREIVLVPLIDTFRIGFGDLGEYSVKLNKLKAFLDSAKENKIWSKYKFINLKYNKQIVCVK